MNKISYLKSIKVVDDGTRKVVLKEEPLYINNIYNILNNRKFDYYLTPLERIDDYEVYPFINKIDIPKSDKSIDLIYLISLLHNKTTSYEEISLDEIKKLYEEIVNEINSKYKYYIELQDEYEEHIIMSPSELLLMKNISKIYYMLNIARNNIELFYKEIETEQHIRKVQIHGNISLEHIIESDNKYLISWKNSRKDYPIIDLVIFYKNDYQNIEIKSLFDEYNKKYQLNKIEKYLFFSLINIPDYLIIKNDYYIDTLKVRNLIDYTEKTIRFTLEENKENQETDK